MSHSETPPQGRAQNGKDDVELANEWVEEDPGEDRPLEVEGTVTLDASIRVPQDATEEQKKQALLTQTFMGEIDDVTGVTIWGQTQVDVNRGAN